MTKKHVIVIVSDEKFGCEHGVYIDGIGLGITEGSLLNDLNNLKTWIKGPYIVKSAAGDPISEMHWPDRLEDVENLVIH